MTIDTHQPAAERLPGYDQRTRRLEWVAFLLLMKLALAAILLAALNPVDISRGKGAVFAAGLIEQKPSANQSSDVDSNSVVAKSLAVQAENPPIACQPRCCMSQNSHCA